MTLSKFGKHCLSLVTPFLACSIELHSNWEDFWQLVSTDSPFSTFYFYNGGQNIKYNKKKKAQDSNAEPSKTNFKTQPLEPHQMPNPRWSSILSLASPTSVDFSRWQSHLFSCCYLPSVKQLWPLISITCRGRALIHRLVEANTLEMRRTVMN